MKLQFKFQKGDIVQVSPGLEFASPLDKSENRREEVEIIEQKSAPFYGGWMKWYEVKSVSNPGRKYVLQENFVRLVRRG